MNILRRHGISRSETKKFIAHDNSYSQITSIGISYTSPSAHRSCQVCQIIPAQRAGCIIGEES